MQPDERLATVTPQEEKTSEKGDRSCPLIRSMSHKDSSTIITKSLIIPLRIRSTRHSMQRGHIRSRFLAARSLNRTHQPRSSNHLPPVTMLKLRRPRTFVRVEHQPHDRGSRRKRAKTSYEEAVHRPLYLRTFSEQQWRCQDHPTRHYLHSRHNRYHSHRRSSSSHRAAAQVRPLRCLRTIIKMVQASSSGSTPLR